MDLEGRMDDESEFVFSEDEEDCNVDFVLEKERCGICIDIVIDRGVLDSCDHWFCFACIDNWAAITNLCPICKIEFQVITCIPVYDTIRGIKSEDLPLSGNDDWCIKGKRSTLSFPSYYISEDAVKCLEGDGCKIRNLQMTEEDLTFDTSIACDSCDMWYHAFCVGFKPEHSCESTWLCPRCISSEVHQNSFMFSLQNHGKYSTTQGAGAGTGWTGDPSLSDKVSVSVADAGETAVVVSMIDGKHNMDCKKSPLNEIETDLENGIPASLQNLNFGDSVLDLHPEDGNCLQLSRNNLVFSHYKGHYTIADVDNSDTFFDISPEIIDFQLDGDLKEGTLPSSFLQDEDLRKPTNDVTESKLPSSPSQVPFPFTNIETINDEKHINELETCNSEYSEVCKELSTVAFVQSEANIEPGSTSYNNNCHGFVAALPVESMSTSCYEDRMCQKDEDTYNLVEKQKMNQLQSPNFQKLDCIRKRETESPYPAKKLKSDGKSKMFSPGRQSASSSQDCAGKDRGNSTNCVKTEDLEVSDIMSIVQENECSFQDLQTGIINSNKFIDSKNSTCGLRVKKIMRRIGEKKESSILAQELGKEIREVVQQKALNDGGKILDFDEKLLAAFRAATVKPKAQLSCCPNLVQAGAKKPLLVKGRKRENLTKKIYGTASGRRRHAWVRDLEIEFWRHRCRSEQSEKVETLQSVLELLKKATDPSRYSSMELVPHEETTDSILSRVYLADASVFPRKDDIKPLSVLENSQLDNQNLDKLKNLRDVSRVSMNDESHSKINPNLITKSSVRVNSSNVVDKKLHAPSFPAEKASQQANSGGAAVESIEISGISNSKASLAFSKGHALPDARTDKRKWAQEVLSRKIASTNVNANKGVQVNDNNTLLKGSYPLLAQLPLDMRPVLVYARHNKVPVSVRQSQLYRIAEHYLRRTNLQVIRRTAETELAVADAVNVEKEIFERSNNSKLVYVNLCSLAVSHRSNKQASVETSISNSTMIIFNDDGEVAEATSSKYVTGQKPESAVTTLNNSTMDISKVANEVEDDLVSEHKAGEWNSVEEALKMAGLFSETPPTSPDRVTKGSNLNEAAQENFEEREGPPCDSLVDALPSRDSKPASSIQQIPGNAAEYDCINLAVEPPFSLSSPLELLRENGSKNSQGVVSVDNCAPTTKHGEENDEPFLEECELMQGANKEHLMNQMSANAINETQKPLERGEEKNENSSVNENCKVENKSVPSMYDSNCDISNATLCDETAAVGDSSLTHSTGNSRLNSDSTTTEEMNKTNGKSELTISISKKVEAYIKEYIRPLCKSGIVTVEQYRWAVGKAVDKVMKFHHNAKNANFLIREGEKVKKLAEQYLEAAQRKESR